MEFRPGTCSACKASFRIPASFTANKAKCSKCGGTVEIGPVTTDAAAAKPSAPSTPAKAVSAPVASAAARLAASPGSTPPPHSPAKPVPARPVPAGAAPAASRSPGAAPAKPVGAAAPSSAKPAHRPAVGVKAPVAAKAGGRKHAEEVEEDDRDEHARRRALLEKKRGPNFLLLGGAVVGVAIVGVVLVRMWSKDVETKAQEAERIALEKTAKDAEVKAERERKFAADQAEDARREDERKNKALLAAEAKQAADAAKAAEAEQGAKDAQGSAKGPMEGFDLTTIPDFGPYEGTTPEQWTEIQGLAATWFDPLAGARSSRARTKLEANPKQAFPAILNGLKKLNLEDEDGYRIADATQKMLEKICHGHNAGWMYRQQENWLQYDQKAIKLWCDMWTRASTDEAYWQKITKQDQAKAPEDGAPAGGADPAKKPDDF